MGGEFGIDPADNSTVFTYRNNSANNTNLSDFTARAVVNLPVGDHDIDVITGDRDGSFHMEVYSRPGNFINTAEYTAGTANNGLANPTSNESRLIGYKGDGTISSLGVSATGWSRRGTLPVNSGTAPAGWSNPLSIPAFEAWLAGNGVTTDPAVLDTVNDRDPQNPATDLGIPNARDFWCQPQFAGTVDDNYYVEGFDATLVVPEAGTYSISWQGDDGGFIEIQNLPPGVGFSRLVAGPAFFYTFRSNPGTTYTIQRSENLLSWTSVGTIVATGTTTTYTSAPLVVGEPRFFYRAAK